MVVSNLRSCTLKKTLISLPALALGISMLANAQAATTPTKVGIIHIQNAILATKDGQKAANGIDSTKEIVDLYDKNAPAAGAPKPGSSGVPTTTAPAPKPAAAPPVRPPAPPAKKP